MKNIRNFAVIAAALTFLFSCDTPTGGETTYNVDEITEEAKLKNIYEGKFLIGNIINDTYMSGNYNKILKAHYNTITCENDMKPDYLAPSSSGGAYTFTKADRMVNAMLDAGMKVHGHTLVWHSQTPGWLTASDAEVNMKTYIDTVMKHFADRVKSWDVINEAFVDNATGVTETTDWRTALRQDSPWFIALGADYVEMAFKTARTADPDAILYYNDYGLNGNNKPMAVRNMIEDINTRYKSDTGTTRNLIEGIGMQGHYGSSWLNDGSFSAIERNMRYYLALGIYLDISELDIEDRSVSNFSSGKNKKMTQEAAKKQAEDYARLFRLLLKLDEEFPDQITRVTMWGIDDRSSWKSEGNPCLFDGYLNPKPAFDAVSDPASY